MEIEIEVYKGQTILYDDDADKFVCQINIEDKYKSTKRASLKDVRKEIDAFVKLNLEFKPFKAFLVNRYSYSENNTDFDICEVTGIRTDGKLICKFQNSSRTDLIKSNEFNRIKIFDFELIKALDELEKEYGEFMKKYRKAKIEITDKFQTVDLSQYSALLKIENNEEI